LRCRVCSQHDQIQIGGSPNGTHRSDCARCKLLGVALTP
jgi:hypothetical protein